MFAGGIKREYWPKACERKYILLIKIVQKDQFL